MDQIEEVAADVPFKNESSIQIKLKDNIQRIILYNQVSESSLHHVVHRVVLTVSCVISGSNCGEGMDPIDS